MAYGFSRAITIDHTKVGSTDSTDFPLLFSGTYTYLKTTGNGGDVQSASGYDIAFYSDAGLTTLLSWEQESWNGSTGAVIYHVKIPTLSSSSDTVIYLAYGNAAIVAFQGGSTGAAWNSNFVATYHLGDGSTLSLADSTANAHTLTNNGTVAAGTGKIGGGASFGHFGNQNLNTGLAMDFGSSATEGTISFWVNPTSLNSGDQWFGVQSTGEFSGWSTFGGTLYYGFNGNGFGDARVILSATGVFPTSTWTKADLVWKNGQAAKLYKNGSLLSTAANNTTVFAVASNFAIGNNIGASSVSLDGLIDEFQISKVARSADWILAGYNNDNSPSTFYSVGSIGSSSSFLLTNRGMMNGMDRGSSSIRG